MRFIIIFVFIINLFASNVDDILKTISKNSPDYTLDLAIAKKIKSLNYQSFKIDMNIKTQYQFMQNFNKVILVIKSYQNLPNQIQAIQDKLNILSNPKSNTEKLQKLYYEKLLNISTQMFEYLSQNLSNIEKQLFVNLKNISFDTNQANQNLKYWNKLLSQKIKENERLNIDLQKWQLLNDTKNMQVIQNLITINQTKEKQIYQKLLDNQTVLWLQAIKIVDKKAFKLDDNILSYSKKVGTYNAITQLVTDFEKYAFGSKVFVYGAKKELELTFSKIVGFINYPLFSVSGRVITPLNFGFFILVLVLGWIVAKYYKYLINRLRHSNNISHSTATLLANMGYYTIVTISFLMALKVVGLDLSSLAIIAGALSVGIGFGLQNIVSNFVSGIILMFERSIKVGDYIQIDNDTRGEVLDISMRSTIIRTNDNINLIIPNQSFIQNNVINWTLGDDIVRFRVPFGVAYGSDIEEIDKIILTALEKSGLPYIKTAKNFEMPPPSVVFMEMGDSSLNFELFVWVKGEYARRPRRTRSNFLKMIYKALNEAGITIPFPQTDLHIVDSVPLEFRLKD